MTRSIALIALLLVSAPATAAKPELERTDLFRAGEGGYFMYRIPGIVVTGRGTILAYCEARAGQGDWTKQDVLLRRSDDGGRTWSEPRKMAVAPPDLKPNPAGVAQGLGNHDDMTAHNAVAIADRQPGVVHFLNHVQYARVFYRRSDDGKTWPVARVIDPGPSGYSDLAASSDGTVYCFYERGAVGGNHFHTEALTLVRLPAELPREPGGPKPLEAGLEPFLGAPKFEAQPVFEGERLPNVVVATDGTVLAVWGWGTVRVRRSEDGGKTWGPEIALREGLNSGGAVVDENTGDILVFTEEKHPPAPLHVFRSTDHGKTWTEQDVVVHPDKNGNVPSMCMNERGITLRHGEHAGRLLRPSRSYAGGNDRKFWPQHYTNAVYSDDGGRTWHASAPFPAMGTGEATLAELSDGRIYYNSRRHLSTDGRNPRMRHIAHSGDGGHTWKGLSVSDVLPDGDQHRDYGLMAGLVRLPVRGRDVLVFSNIDSPQGRHGGTVWVSFDGGETWPRKRLVEKGGFAYSSLAAGRPETPSEGWIYLLYEGSGGGRVARFNLAWLLAGEPTGNGEVPKEL